MLWEEGKAALEQLLKFMVHPAISSINLTTALGSLASIARQRPMFMSEVIQAYETLHGESRTRSAPRDSCIPSATPRERKRLLPKVLGIALSGRSLFLIG